MTKDPKEHPCQDRQNVSRRGFIATISTGAVAAATVTAAGQRDAVAAEIAEIPEGAETVRITLLVNGRSHNLLVEPRWSLLYVLRERIGLTAAKPGCERGECGACTVLINDQPRYACMTLAVEAAGFQITTLEGLMNGEELGPVSKHSLNTMLSSAVTAPQARS